METRPLEELFEEPIQNDGVRCSSPNPNGYTSPDNQFLEQNGRNLTSLMRTGSGVKGVVVPRATRLGGSRGYDPNKKVIINVDPDDKDGFNCVVDLAAFSSEDITETFNSLNDPNKDIRAVASNTFLKLAHTKPSAKISIPTMKPKISEKIQNSIQQNESVSNQPTVMADLIPSYKATIEISGLGEVEAYYHDIVHHDSFLILAFDNRCTNSIRFMPQATNAPVYVQVEKLDKVFHVQSVGIRFNISNLDVCVLLVEQAAELVKED